MPLNCSDGSGLPEPENPTGFGQFLQTRSYPNPKISGFLKPEATRARRFQDFISPKLPKPEIQTRGYPTGLGTLKITQIISKIGILDANSRNFQFYLRFHEISAQLIKNKEKQYLIAQNSFGSQKNVDFGFSRFLPEKKICYVWYIFYKLYYLEFHGNGNTAIFYL